MKQCSKCQKKLDIKSFRNKTTRGKQWKNSICKKCESDFQKENYKKKKHTLDYVVSLMYTNQVINSRKRKHHKPKYSRDELKKWIVSQNNFNEIMLNWKQSGYKRMMKPSVDRLDDYKGYCFSNIRLVTAMENIRKAHNDRKNGINNKISEQISMFDKKGKKIKTFESSMIAYRETGINPSNIRQCVRGLRKSAGGYLWSSN